MTQGKKLIIALSGGKDSTALALMAAKKGWNIHSLVYFKTGWDFPGMGRHVKEIAKQTTYPLITLKPKIPYMVELMLRGWPGIHHEWCRWFKRDTIKSYVEKFNAILLIGYSANEKLRTRKKDYIYRDVSFPLISWGKTEEDNLLYCKEKGFEWGGLYNYFSRVSCFCCPFKAIDDYRKIRKHFPELWQKMLDWDKYVVVINKGFSKRKTVHDLENRFASEEKEG